MMVCGSRAFYFAVKISMTSITVISMSDMWMLKCGYRNVDVGMWMLECGCWNVDVGMWMLKCGC